LGPDFGEEEKETGFRGIARDNRNVRIGATDILFLLTSHDLRIKEELVTEEERIQLISSEASQSFEKSGILHPQILNPEEAKADDEQRMVELVREREDIKRRREIEEKKNLSRTIQSISLRKKSDPNYFNYIKREDEIISAIEI
jgi:hypothetical protein